MGQLIVNTVHDTIHPNHLLPAASILQRIGAVLINTLVLLISVIVGSSVLGMLLGSYQLAIFILVGIVVIVQLYYMSKYRQTLGKHLLKIKVVRYPNDEISFGRYLARELIDIFCGQILSLLYVIPNLIMAIVNRKDFNRGLTDAIIGTRVVKL